MEQSKILARVYPFVWLPNPTRPYVDATYLLIGAGWELQKADPGRTSGLLVAEWLQAPYPRLYIKRESVKSNL